MTQFDSATAFAHLVDHDAVAAAKEAREARASRNEATVTPNGVLAALAVKIIEMDKDKSTGAQSPFARTMIYMRGGGGVKADGSPRVPDDRFWNYFYAQLSEIEGLKDIIALEGAATSTVDETAIERRAYDKLLAAGKLTPKQHADALAELEATATKAATAAPAVTTDLTADLG